MSSALLIALVYFSAPAAVLVKKVALSVLFLLRRKRLASLLCYELYEVRFEIEFYFDRGALVHLLRCRPDVARMFRVDLCQHVRKSIQVPLGTCCCCHPQNRDLIRKLG